MDKISEFQGQYRWLSNFWPAKVTLDGLEYPSVEHAYQAAKYPIKTKWGGGPFAPDGSLTIREYIRNCKTASEAKRRGKSLGIRLDWFEVRLSIMEDLVRQKFMNNAYNPEMRDCLFLTGDAILEEGNYWGDTYWGICKGVGQNHLGKILMKIREELK